MLVKLNILVSILCWPNIKLSIHESCHAFIKRLMVYIKIKGNMNEMIHAYCKTMLTFACDCVEFNCSDLSQLDRPWTMYSGK